MKKPAGKMKYSLYIGKAAGARIYIHWTFFLFLAWIIAGDISAGAGFSEVLFSLAFILSVFACVVLHELGHAIMARQFKCETQDITLSPLGGIARLGEIPEKPIHELWVALAGPAVNVIIAGIIFLVFLVAGMPPILSVEILPSWGHYFSGLLIVNCGLVIFNLLPAFPMDGGRVLRALLSMYMSRVKATALAALTGQVFAVIFILAGLFLNPVLSLIGVFIFLMAQGENEAVRMKAFLGKYKVSDVLMTSYHILADRATLEEAARKILDTQSKEFLVMSGAETVGVVNADMIIKGISYYGPLALVSDVMEKKFTVLSPSDTLDKVFLAMNAAEIALFPVLHEGKLTGVVDMDNILEWVMIRNALIRKEKKSTSLQPPEPVPLA